MSWERVMEWLLGLAPPGPGQGFDWSLTSQFPWSNGMLWLFLCLAVVFVVGIYRRELPNDARWRVGLLAGLRLLSIGWLLWMLAEAALTIEKTGLPYLLIMVDNSASMASDDAYTDPQLQQAADALRPAAAERFSRFDQARELLTQNDASLPRQLLARHKLRLYAVSEGETLIGPGDWLSAADLATWEPAMRELSPKGEQSRLGEALRRSLVSLRGTPPTAVVLLTDGVVTDGERLTSAAQYARQKSIAIYPVALGNSDPTRDVELHDVIVDDVAFVDDPIRIVCKMTSQGLAGETAQVVVRFGADGEPLTTQAVALAGDLRTRRVELTVTPRQVGEFDVIIETLPLPRESNLGNNRETRRISVRKEKIRVLLAEGLPRWEYRELKVLLEREKTVDVKTMLQDADPEFTREDRTAIANFPVRKEELFGYDVVILGDLDPALVSASVLENLREFVREKGGGLVVIAGPRYIPRSLVGTPLETLVPVELSGLRPESKSSLTESFRPDLTAEGRKGVPFFRLADSEGESMTVWERLPGLYWMVESPVVRKGAQVLVKHPHLTGESGKLPLIAMQRFGAGKVLYHATDETWRWRFRTGDLYYGRFWVQVLRYLSRSKLLGRDRAAELSIDRRTYRVGDAVNLRVRFLDEQMIPPQEEGVQVLLERGGGGVPRRVTLRRAAETPSVFEAVVPDLGEGAYHAWIAAPVFGGKPPSQDFRIESPARETKQIRADLGELNRLAQTTGGKLYTVATAANLPRELPAGRPVALKTHDPVRLWNHWLTLVLFISTLSAEWILRKRSRLV